MISTQEFHFIVDYQGNIQHHEVWWSIAKEHIKKIKKQLGSHLLSLYLSNNYLVILHDILYWNNYDRSFLEPIKQNIEKPIIHMREKRFLEKHDQYRRPIWDIISSWKLLWGKDLLTWKNTSIFELQKNKSI